MVLISGVRYWCAMTSGVTNGHKIASKLRGTLMNLMFSLLHNYIGLYILKKTGRATPILARKPHP